MTGAVALVVGLTWTSRGYPKQRKLLKAAAELGRCIWAAAAWMPNYGER